jgi:hypothetical protein
MSAQCSTAVAETTGPTGNSDSGIGEEVTAIEMEKAEKSIFQAPKAPAPSAPRVKLRRIDANLAKAYPPDGANELWWCRLKSALATQSSAFANACLFQLQAAARLPGGGISEIAVNAPLAMVEAAQPRDEIEAALAVQMACTHTAMAVLACLGGQSGGQRRVAARARRGFPWRAA